MRIFRYILATAFLFVAAARGQLSFILTPSAQIGTAINEMVLTGALTNLGRTNLYLNDVQCVLIDSASNVLLADAATFFANVPGILSPRETYADAIFSVSLGPVAAPGIYNGTITVLGGSNIFATSNLATESFQISLPDTVGDGIPDWWRQLYFGGDGSSTNEESCATCDADDTGADNYLKYVIGLNPTNSASVFTLNITNYSPLLLSFGPIAAGRVVVPEFSDDLSSGEWTNLVSPIATTTNGSLFFVSDPAA